MLSQIAVVKNVDVMTTLEINKDSIRESMDRGMDGDEILSFLEESNRGAVPETVRHLVSELNKKHGEINISMASAYIKTGDPVLFESLKRNRRFKEVIKDTIDDKAIVLHPAANLQKLATDLQKLGYLPEFESENVQVGRQGKVLLSLTQDEFYHVLAVLNFIQMIEDEFGESITEDKTMPLIEKLKADLGGTKVLSTFGVAMSKTFFKRFMGVLGGRIDKQTKKYKKQISRLMETVPRTQNKYDFSGPNPATKKKDIKKMLDFASKHELPLEVRFLNRHEEENKDILEPESVDGNKVYGFFKYKDDYSVVRIDRIVKLKLM
jgi:hypothetical protein